MTNQRPIKFRAWDPKRNVMRRVRKIFYRYKSYSIKDTIDEIFVNYWDVESKKDKYGKEFYVDSKYLMQFTGLHDKNGVEIYDGDIVKNEDNGFIGIVHYQRGGFWVYEFKTHVDKGIFDDDMHKECTWSINLDYEIIGNIYENPELLNNNN